MLDFMNTRNQKQLSDGEKLMMSCPESSAGSPTPGGLSLNCRMSATAGPLFGEGACQSPPLQRGEQVGSPIRDGPCTAGPGPGNEAPSGLRMSCEWATEQSVNMPEESWCSVLLDITRAFESGLPITPIIAVRWRLLKMCTSSHSSSSRSGAPVWGRSQNMSLF